MDFDFPTNQILAAGARLLVVGFDPADTNQLTAFRSKFGISNSVPIFGPWDGKLDNSGETIELKQPDEPSVSGTNLIVPFIMIDKVAYSDSAPWPPAADGIGNSLQRFSRTGFGNDPTNWFAAGFSPGRTNVFNALPDVAITSPGSGESYEFGASVIVAVQASDPGGSISRVELREGNFVLREWTNSGPFTFVWNTPPAGKHRLHAIAHDNLGGVVHSAAVEFRVIDPPVLSLLSQLLQIPEGDSGTNQLLFNVVLSRPTLQTVSFRFATSNFNAIAGSDYIATNGLLTIPPGFTNAQFAVRIRGDEVPEDDEYFQVFLSNPTNGVFGLSAGYVQIVNDDLSEIDHLTELFMTTNDLAFRSITFTPDGSPTFYSVCQEPATNFPTLPAGGTTVTIGDDDSRMVTLPASEKIAIYEHRTNVFFIGSNGYLTVGSGDGSFSADYATHFYLPRVSALLNDLNPVTGGNVSWRKLNDRVAVTYQRVPRFGNSTQTNSFQIEMFFDGRIRLTYLTIKSPTSLVGLSRGLGTPPGMLPSDFRAYPSCGPADADGDGMPDAWELVNGTNPLVNDRLADLDGDGLNNFQEFLAGTSATNSTSALKFNSADIADGKMILGFTAMSNHSYTIQQRGELAPNVWQNWQNILSVPTNRSIRLTNTLAPTGMLYRIVTPQQ